MFELLSFPKTMRYGVKKFTGSVVRRLHEPPPRDRAVRLIILSPQDKGEYISFPDIRPGQELVQA